MSSAEAPGDRPRVRYASASFATIEVWRRSPGRAGLSEPPWPRLSAGAQQLPKGREVVAGDRLAAGGTGGGVERGPVIARQHPEGLAVQDAGLDERLDRRRPCAAVVAVAVLD